MKVEFWYIGKTNEKYLGQGIQIFEKRLRHYCKYASVCIRDVKPGQNSRETKARESEVILSKLSASDYLVLLDEVGESFTSEQFALQVEKYQMQGSKRIVFLVAGAFGADEKLQKRANKLLSLSKMTFSHQMIRLFFLEQLYRAFTIIRNEKYHNP
ncbi:MAG: 23S rRNA (pseudouridine(1915)-N(3))-methyltransferase RlmH [Saprospiraceae bacterium]|nr:23S rRNA (pseudouridine(1915)-N(3))-methyltransferase RlmH [Saprospiraceae bacterium]